MPGQSIFTRKKPLSPKTMARLVAGLERFGGKELEPFLLVPRNHADGQSLGSDEIDVLEAAAIRASQDERCAPR